METPDFTPVVDRASPRHRWFEEQNQYRLKVQSYTSAPPEITVQKISFEKEFERYRHAADKGYTSCFPVRGKRVQSDQPRSIESLERAQFRAKTNVRKLVTELAPTALVTFTTRELLTIDQLLWVWQRFGVIMRSAGVQFEYVAVPERHPTNPEHLHLHVAYRGRTPFNLIRRFWHMALESRHGRRVSVVLRGDQSPGNIDVQPIKVRDDIKRIRKIAKYIAKYITKDLIAEFNRKRYWPSKGISLESARVYWLDSLSQFDAVREACQMVGEWVDDLDVCAQKVWAPSDRVAFIAVDPSLTPPPPF